MFGLDGLFQKITVSYVGYRTREFLLDNEIVPREIMLEQDVDLLDPVSITAPTVFTGCSRLLMGGLTVARRIPVVQNVVRNIHQWLPNPNVRVFPNPVFKGQSLNVQLSLPTQGKYALKVFAADGRLVHTQALQITSFKQTIQFPVPAGFASGTYWLYVQDGFGKKGHEVKFIIR